MANVTKANITNLDDFRGEPLVAEAIEATCHNIIHIFDGGEMVWEIDENGDLNKRFFEFCEDFDDAWDYDREMHYTTNETQYVMIDGCDVYQRESD